MSNNKGIFEPHEGFASVPPVRSPFAIDDSPGNPFASGPESKSPFAVDTDEDTGKAGRSAEKQSEPFATEPGKSPFSYEPPVAGFGGSPFGGSPSPAGLSQDTAFAANEPKAEQAPTPPPIAEAAPVREAPAPAPAVVAAAPAAEPSYPETSFESDSSSIRQLELRAIFGVDRELSESEILERSRSLPGIRHLGRVGAGDVGAIEAVKRVVENLGFGAGQVKLSAGGAPVEFVREGKVFLAVQTDGSFAPGVKETLMIVARELGRM